MSDLPKWDALTGEEKDAIIRPLWRDGKSASQIAFCFAGATRNAVIGRVTRGKMGARVQQPATPRQPRAPKPPKPKPAPKARPIKPRPPLASAVPEFEPAPVPPGGYNPVTDLRPPLDGLRPISILELPDRPGSRCRFPVVGGFCGHSIGKDEVYCGPHAGIAFNPITRSPANGSLARKR